MTNPLDLFQNELRIQKPESEFVISKPQALLKPPDVLPAVRNLFT
jgi:hypothetical protein